MKLLPLAIFVASIPAIISILLFLMRNKIASLRAGNGDEDTVKGAYDDRQNARDGVRLARLIPPSERPRSTPTSAQTEIGRAHV